MQNPVTPIVYQLLEESPQGFSLLDLIKRCDQLNLFDALPVSDFEMILFYKNFFAMNALFAVQDQLFNDKVGILVIESIRCSFAPIHSGDQHAITLAHQDAALKAYYQDWSSLNEITADEVNHLLNSFWDKYLALDEVTQHCKTLKVTPSELSREKVKQQFRALASQHHPDKGGDGQEFIRLRRAYESLMKVCDAPV